MMKYLFLCLIVFISSCDSRTSTHMIDISVATELCKNSEGIKELKPIVSDEWYGNLYCNNGARFIYNKDGVVK